jgi:alpha-L-rhamnosidase
VRIHYGERLNPDGTVNEWGLNDTDGPPQTDYYTSRGGGTESWSPKFSYKGFRYVEIDDCPVRLAASNVEICTVHSAVRSIGDFSCSNSLFNTLHQNEVRTLLNNLHGKPTDTPAYEKNGWMGDANVAAETALYNLDLTAFFEKWIDDIHDSMRDDGLVPVIAPTGGWGMSHSPEWNSAYVFIPWHLFQYAGDRGLLRQQYDGFRKYAAFERSQLKNGISNSVLSDWLAPDPDGRPSGAQAPEGGALTSTAYAYRTSQLLGEIARLEGKKADARAADETCSQIRAALNTRFFDRENRTYHTDVPAGYRQTSNLLPLAWGLVRADDRKRVLERLVEEIHRKGDHLDTGCLGTKYLLPLLTEEGYGDVAYAIANQKSYPGWGWWVAHGATTMWEAWELSARSYDHYFLGTIDEWFFKYLAGIRSDGDGFREITIHPYLLGDLASAQAHVDTVRGRVSSSWLKGADGRVKLDVVIPPTAQATVFVPAPSGAVVTESGAPTERAPGVRLLGRKGDTLLYRVGSGTYRFRSTVGPQRRPGLGGGNSTLR